MRYVWGMVLIAFIVAVAAHQPLALCFAILAVCWSRPRQRS